MRARTKIVAACAITLCAFCTWANWPTRSISPGATADKIIVLKSQRQLNLYSKGHLLKTYNVSLGRPIGPKQQEGDNRTPEGLYTIELHKADSSFHKALKVSYPSTADCQAASKRGVKPGGDIMIHGLRNGLGLIGRLHRLHDWTAGCIAVTNPEIEEIYRAVPDGTPVEIRP
ncbi:MAG: hypothetical protein C5B50_06495 [Verrucomicrobia bacterium]|nr:MAG: hypothetical protein C5B50_06495 [Verrucomicrobiota bacterium]